MKINITKKQFEILIRAVEAGTSVYGILGDAVSDDYKKQSDEIEKLRKYLLGFAKDFEMKEITEEFMGELIMNEDFCDEFHEVIEDYNDETFWHELEARLGKRDFERSVTKDELEEMKENGGWYPKRIQGIYDKWSKEFYKYGIERLEIKKK